MKIMAMRQKCAGHARCAAVAGQLFDLNADGYIGFEVKAVPAGLEALARLGVRACPERALKLAEDEAVQPAPPAADAQA
jgi:ferredoxin